MPSVAARFNLVQLLVVVVVVAALFVLWNTIHPLDLLRSSTPHTASPMDEHSGSEGDAYACIDAAESANDAVAESTRAFAGQSRHDDWADRSLRLSSTLDAAAEVCRCSEPGCDLGLQAIDELRSEISELDAAASDTSTRVPGLHRQHVYDLIAQARRAAGSAR